MKTTNTKGEKCPSDRKLYIRVKKHSKTRVIEPLVEQNKTET